MTNAEADKLPEGPVTDYLLGIIGHIGTGELSQILPDARWSDDLDFDSIDLVEVIVGADEALGAVIPEEACFNIETVRDVWRVISDRVAAVSFVEDS
jgi:acyl carrier protein